MIKETKKRIAREHIEEFLKRMSDLGFDQQDILSMLNDMSKELKK